MFTNSLLSPSEEPHTCHGGCCTQTAIFLPSWPRLNAWCGAHESASQKASVQCSQGISTDWYCKYVWPDRFQHRFDVIVNLSLVGVQLIADSVGPAKLLLQLTGALHIHGVALLQEAHLPAQVSQILKLPFVCLNQRFKLVHPVRRVPEGEERTVWEVLSTSTGIWLLHNTSVWMCAQVLKINNSDAKQCQRMKFILSTRLSERGAEWTSVRGQCGSCFCERTLIIDELVLKWEKAGQLWQCQMPKNTMNNNVLSLYNFPVCPFTLFLVNDNDKKPHC